MVQNVPDLSRALCSIPSTTKRMERLFWLLWVMKYGKEGVQTGSIRISSDITPECSPGAQASRLLYHTHITLYNKVILYLWTP